jgi:DNA-binding MarR family transcriptional regulator/N-acetylglutamate synthase-like GNAT family acetyltransferase
MPVAADIARVRSFNRLVTRQAGVVGDRHLGRRPFGETRVLYEIGLDGAAPRDLRARLGLDSGYLSRLLGALQRERLVEAAPDPTDRRTKRLSLTRAGEAELDEINRISDELAAAVLEPLTGEQRERLLRAQDEVRHLLALSMVTIELEDPRAPDARWCLSRYAAELDERFEEGFDATVWPADATRFVIARIDGQPAGCGVLKTLSPEVGELARMWVDRPHRGLGIATRILAALEQQASELGFTTVRLDTNRALDEAKEMYAGAGYAEIPRYNNNPYANHWFEKRLA